MNWFKIYKIPAGKPANHFAFNGEAKDKVCLYLVFSGKLWMTVFCLICRSLLCAWCRRCTISGKLWYKEIQTRKEFPGEYPWCLQWLTCVFTIHSPSPVLHTCNMLSTNTTLTGNPHHISAADAKIIVADTPPVGPAQAIPPEGRVRMHMGN